MPYTIRPAQDEFDDSDFDIDFAKLSTSLSSQTTLDNQLPEDEEIVPDYLGEFDPNITEEIIYISSDEEEELDITVTTCEEYEAALEKNNITHKQKEREYIDISSDDEYDARARRNYNLRKRKIKQVSSNFGVKRRARLDRGFGETILLPEFPRDYDGYYCAICSIEFSNSNSYNPFFRPTRYSRSSFSLKDVLACYGCTKLLETVRTLLEKNDMFTWFICGKLPRYDRPPQLTERQKEHRIAIRRKAMQTRCCRHGGLIHHVMSQEALMKMTKAGNVCAVSGWPTHFHDFRYGRLPYWATTYDHIIPLSLLHSNPVAAWSPKNIQPMCHTLNAVKGSYRDDHLREWYKSFLKSLVIEI